MVEFVEKAHLKQTMEDGSAVDGMGGFFEICCTRSSLLLFTAPHIGNKLYYNKSNTLLTTKNNKRECHFASHHLIQYMKPCAFNLVTKILDAAVIQ